MYLLKLVHLLNKRDLVPDFISSYEKKVFALAMSLTKEPDILLCDLNLTGVDEEKSVINAFKDISSLETGIIVTAQKMVDYKMDGIKYLDMKNGSLK
jgi:ABC-type ATPase involved in cell division